MTTARPPRLRRPTEKAIQLARRRNAESSFKAHVHVQKQPGPLPPDDSSEEQPCSNNVDRNEEVGPVQSSQERTGNVSSQQEEASSVLHNIINSAVLLRNRPQSVEVDDNRNDIETDVNKEELINKLKIEVDELRSDKKLLLEHIEVLGALRKQLEKNIVEMKSQMIPTDSSSRKRRAKKRRSNDEEIDISELCIFNESRYRVRKTNGLESLKRSLMQKDVNNLVIEIAIKMYVRMNSLALFYCNDSNYLAFIDGSGAIFGVRRKFPNNAAKIVYDWEDLCYCLKEEEAERLGLQELSVYQIEKVSGNVHFMMKSPIDRMNAINFFEQDEEKTVRYLTNHGYIFLCEEMRGKYINVQKSGFMHIMANCDELKQRLLQCSNYNVGNRKRIVKTMYLHALGYVSEKGKVNCSCVDETIIDVDEHGGSTYVRQVECSECSKNSEKLVKRSTDGTLVTNWWRKAMIEDISKEGAYGGTARQQIFNSPHGINKLFMNAPSEKCFRRFFEYETESAIDHDLYTSIVNIARMDAWMTVVLHHNMKEAFRTRKGGNNIHVILNDMKDIRKLATSQLQTELLDTLKTYLSEQGYVRELEDELCVWRGENDEEVCNNSTRKYTIAVPVDNEGVKEYHICIKPHIFKKCISSRIGEVKDCYIGKVTVDNNVLRVI